MHKKIGIIGSGPGAAMVCKNLLNRGFNITVFEKGKFFKQNEISPYSIDEIDNKYEGGGTTAIFGTSVINYGAGSCLGGGSEVNAGLYYRTPEQKIKNWKNILNGLENEIFSEDVFSNIERLLSVQFSQGDLPIASKKFIKGSEKMKLSPQEIPRWIKYKKTRNQLTVKRQSMTEVFWNKNMDALELKLNTEVRQIRLLKDGVELSWIEKEKKLAENFDIVFLCCGAINTPYLLMCSRLLKNNLVSNFSFHPTIKVLAKFPDNISDPKLIVPSHQIKFIKKDIGLGVSIGTEKLIKMNMIGSGFEAKEVLNDYKNFGLFYCMTTSENGYICKVPFLGEPFPFALKQNKSNKRLLRGISILEEILIKAGAEKVRLVGNTEDLKDKLIEKKQQVNRAEKMTIHLMSSCPLGLGKSPVNQFGELKRDKRILIADSSIIPSVLGVNPQGTVMALANFVSRKFLERVKK